MLFGDDLEIDYPGIPTNAKKKRVAMIWLLLAQKIHLI
jgi:hypothetical protein